MKKLIRYFQTLRYLKFIQIRYQVFYRLRRLFGLQPKVSNIRISKVEISNLSEIQLLPSIPSYHSFLSGNKFRFLNLEQDFRQKIDWNFVDHGKLWTYNLNYFEFLEQPDFDQETGVRLIKDFIKNEANLKDGLEPFPISLRTIFWIKFLVKNRIRDPKIDAVLLRHLKILTRQIEYHLLGNHLLENGFALLFGAYYFSNKQFYSLARKILDEQLNEQILEDGAHFERSPMYHSLMLFRVLDCVNLIENNASVFLADQLPFFKEKAEKMLGWLEAIRFSDGTLPRVKDSTEGIAPIPENLLRYSNRLGLRASKTLLGNSNFRMQRSENYECFVDIGGISPSYQPGHAHADIFNFEVHHQGQPLIVDTGISTYEKNNLRNRERSTEAHNTVQIGDAEQSDMWGGFRVAQRAKVVALTETETSKKATHDGYKSRGVLHERIFEFRDSAIEIQDFLNADRSATLSGLQAKAFFHFHPKIKIELQNDRLIGDFGSLIFTGFERIVLEKYNYAYGYNKTEEAVKATVFFNKHLRTKIHLL